MSAPDDKTNARIRHLVTANKLIMPKFLEKERDLMKTKWFDYRFISPVDATAEFALQYRIAFKNFIHRNIDFNLASNVVGIQLTPPMRTTKSYSQLWAARQKADEMCIPYQCLIDFSINFHGLANRNYLPRPNQLFPTDASGAAFWNMFQHYLEEHDDMMVSFLKGLPQYSTENYRSLSPQIAVREWILEAAKRSTRSWRDLIGRSSFDRRIIPIHEWRPLLINDDFDDIIAGLTSDQVHVEGCTSEKVDDADFLFSCFGLLASLSPETDQCKACPLFTHCIKVTEEVAAILIKETGTSTPRLTETRSKGNERVKKHRAMKKAKEAGAHYGSNPD